MKVTRLNIQNFRGISSADLFFDGHTLLIGRNNVGKSTICDALDLVLGPDRLARTPAVEEFDFYNARYLDEDGQTPVPIRIEVLLTDLTAEVARQCFANLEHWHKNERRLLGSGEIDQVDAAEVERCLRLTTIAKYDPEEDQFTASTVYSGEEVTGEDEPRRVPNQVKRAIGFLYLRALRTGSRALSLERGSLLDIILRMKDVRTGLWERTRKRLAELDPPIDSDATELGPILDEIESRLSDYIQTGSGERSARLFVSQLTREHLRKTIAFFLTMGQGEASVPFQEAGTGTLNILVLALLTFIAEIKKDNVIFAMEEPEIALPPHTQRRVAKYLLEETTQSFVTSHSPYVIERFEPEKIIRLSRDASGMLTGVPVTLPHLMKPKSYRQSVRRALAEAMLGQGVIVGEGITEREALQSCANTMEESDASIFSFDVAGLSVIDAEGDGNLERLGQFFKPIEIPAFAFFDRKRRSRAEVDALAVVYEIANEIPYQGAEALLVAEVPVDRQWQFLQALREEDPDGHYGIPADRPNEEQIKEHALQLLKGLKGAGGAARLLDLCTADELPRTIRAFLRSIYERYPKPQRRQTSLAQTPGTSLAEASAVADGAGAQSAAAVADNPPGDET
jgi:putative ATP-dependent endonuclease of the OLD family